jgi:hypothetical protein
MLLADRQADNIYQKKLPPGWTGVFPMTWIPARVGSRVAQFHTGGQQQVTTKGIPAYICDVNTATPGWCHERVS